MAVEKKPLAKKVANTVKKVVSAVKKPVVKKTAVKKAPVKKPTMKLVTKKIVVKKPINVKARK